MIEKAGVAIIRLVDGVWHALLVKQKASGKWCFPKGNKSRHTESWQSCAKRELAEETGLYINIQKEHIPFKAYKTAIYVYNVTNINYIHLFHSLKTKDPEEIEAIAWKPIYIKDNKIFNDSIYNLHVVQLFESIISTPKKLHFYPLSLVDMTKLKQMCVRSKWTPTQFFSKKTTQTKRLDFWR